MKFDVIHSFIWCDSFIHSSPRTHQISAQAFDLESYPEFLYFCNTHVRNVVTKICHLQSEVIVSLSWKISQWLNSSARRIWLINSQGQRRSDRYNCLLAGSDRTIWHFLGHELSSAFQAVFDPEQVQAEQRQRIRVCWHLREFALKMAWGVQNAWACAWESQVSCNLAEYLTGGAVWCFGKRCSSNKRCKRTQRDPAKQEDRVRWYDIDSVQYVCFHRQLQIKWLKFSSC